ncbi:hypothetical protein KQH50_02500 [bacterium]|nr:hypothetical protein [bacterium]
MKNEFIGQYAHSWKVFKRLVRDFDAEAWLHTGRGAMTPVRLSHHILGSTKYYIEDAEALHYASGKPFELDWVNCPDADLPSQADLLDMIETFAMRTERWLNERDYDAPNETFPWAGETQMGVVIFLLKHSLYHLGELSALLNESKDGEVEDHYVKANQTA